MIGSRGPSGAGPSLNIDTQRVLAEARIERQREREERAETFSVRVDDWNAQAQAQREEYERTRAEAQLQAQAQAEEQARAFAEQQQAFAEAATASQRSQLVLIPADEEADPLSGGDAANVTGAFSAELAELLEGVDVPEELRRRLDNLRAALASADTLIERGFIEQARAMRAALQQSIDDVVAELGVSRDDGAPAGTDPAPALESTALALDAPSSLDPAEPRPPRSYFTGSFDQPPWGGWFYGVGDHGRTGQDGHYEWLPRIVELRAEASAHGHYLLTGSDQVTTVERHLADVAAYLFYEEEQQSDDGGYRIVTTQTSLTREEAIARLREDGQTDAQIADFLRDNVRYMMQAGGTQYSENGSTTYAPIYGTRAEYLELIGIGAGAPDDLQIAFNNSGSGDGDAWLDVTHATVSLSEGSTPGRAYTAIVDDRLAAEWVQIGDAGPLGDDIGQMLGSIYENYGATTEEQREALRNTLFKYDERFGILARREFIAAAVERNNDRRQGFFEGPIGRTLLTVAASFIPGAGPYVAMALNAGFQLHDGASFGQALRGAAVSYFANTYGAQFGNWVGTTFGQGLSPAMAAVLEGAASRLGSTAITQLAMQGRLDVGGLLAAAVGGGFGSYITSFVDDSDFGRAIDERLGRGRAGDFLGRLSESVARSGGLDAQAVLNACAAGRADAQRIDGADGTHIVTTFDDGSRLDFAPDGSFTLVTAGPNGEALAHIYDPAGNLIAVVDAFTCMPVDPTTLSSSTNIDDVVDIQLTTGELVGNLGEILGLSAGELGIATDAPMDREAVLALIADMVEHATPEELALLEENDFGLGSSVPWAAAAGDAVVDLPPPDLTNATYLRAEDGTELWRNPETGEVVYQRLPDGTTHAVVGNRRIVTDPQGHIVSVHGGSFDDAFAQARASGSAVFQWNGQRYTTTTRTDIVRASGRDVDAYERFVREYGNASIEAFDAHVLNNKWEVVANSGIDAPYWRDRGFSPEDVLVFYAINGFDHQRLANLGRNGAGPAAPSTTDIVLANVGRLPDGAVALYGSFVDGLSNFLTRQQAGGPPMSAFEAFGAVASYLVDRGASAADSLRANTSGVGEGSLVVTGAVLHTAWESTGGALERAWNIMTDPRATDVQIGAASLEFFGAITFLAGTGVLTRGATTGVGVTLDGVTQSLGVAGRGIFEAAGGIVPDSVGHVPRFDWVTPAPHHFSPDAAAVQARIDNFNFDAFEDRIVTSLGGARVHAEVHVTPYDPALPPQQQGPGGRAYGINGDFDIDVRSDFITYELLGGQPLRDRDGLPLMARGHVPDGLEVIGYDITAPAVLRHEVQHTLDYREAARDPSSPNLLRMAFPNAGHASYEMFTFTELNAFPITADELGTAYAYAVATGDLATAATIVQAYSGITDHYLGMLQRSVNVLESGLTPEGRALVSATAVPSATYPRNNGFDVWDFQTIGPNGLPVQMQAQIPTGTPAAMVGSAVLRQMESAAARLTGYRDTGFAILADLNAIRTHFNTVARPVPPAGGG